MAWTEHEKRRLFDMIQQDGGSLSLVDIAAAMGRTKNSILGMVHRMISGTDPLSRKFKEVWGLRNKVSRPQVRRERRVSKPAAAAERRFINPPPRRSEPSVPSGPGVSLMELERHHCRFPTEGGRYCGAEAVELKPYCQYHNNISRRDR